jgi:hypothetical protein
MGVNNVQRGGKNRTHGGKHSTEEVKIGQMGETQNRGDKNRADGGNTVQRR